MLRLSKLTDYAVVVLVRLSREQGVQTSPGIAATTGIPEPTVAKVLKTLATGGLVVSQLLTLYITPVIYLYLEQFQAWLRGRKGTARRQLDQAAVEVS